MGTMKDRPLMVGEYYLSLKSVIFCTTEATLHLGNHYVKILVSKHWLFEEN